MKTHLIWKITLVVIFLAAALCLTVQPALADDNSKNKDKNQPTVNADQKDNKNHPDEIDQILANGPPIPPDPVIYIKIVPGNDKIMIKEFKNGRPNLKSGWIPYQL